MSPHVRTPRPLNLGALSVLVVDDQPFFRVLLTEVLRGLGIGTVSVAVDGEDGYTAFRDICPDIVVTDWMMPKLDGINMTRRIRDLSDARFQQVPVILVTANSDRTQIEHARSAGIDEFILKPISGKAICDRLREVIEKPRPFVTFETYTGPCRRRRTDTLNSAPYRRFDDSYDREGTEAVVLSDGLQSVFIAGCARITHLAQGLTENHANIRPIVTAISELQAVAGDMSDKHLERVCELLLGLTVTMVKTRNVAPDPIRTHMNAIEILLRTPSFDIKTRDEIVCGLERITNRASAA